MKLFVEKFGRESMLVKLAPDVRPSMLDAVARMPGATFVKEAYGGPGFKIYLDMTNCKRLRSEFGDHITFSDEIMQWGIDRETEARKLRELASASTVDDDDLPRVQQHLPEMWKLLRPYQKSGIKYIAHSPNPLVADDQGLGKTWEVIGGIFESGMDAGPNLIVCPKISIESVWLYELSRFQDHAIFVAPEGRKQREQLLEEVEFALETELPFWLVINPAMLTYRKTNDDTGYFDSATQMWYDCQFPFITRTKWNTLVLDEAHLSGIANPNTQTARAIAKLSVKKKIATTGTPAGGKARRLWGILHWLEPKEFKSRNRWNEQWLERKVLYDVNGQERTEFVGLDPKMEQSFYKAHAQYILRRKKEEVYTEMPPKQYIDMTVEMTERQRKQYEQMENEAYVRLDQSEASKGGVNVTNVLATFSWLKQFANAFCELEEKERIWDDMLDDWVIKYKATPTEESPKLEALMGILDGLGIPDGDEQAVVFTQFSGMANMVHAYLNKKGIPTEKITGAVSNRQKRSEIQSQFQAGEGAKVVVMTTKAGGVSINMDRANTVIFLDETWDPDDRLQAEDRAHRASRIHQVTVYTIRTKGTIETQLIKRTLKDKRMINDILLDMYRKKGEDE
jgi:SNF2 family DNA or RNA helicase